MIDPGTRMAHGQQDGLRGFEDGQAVTPNDGTPLPFVCDAITVNVTGTVTIITPAGTTVQWTASQGQVYYMRAATVKATGTAATGIVAWYY